MRQHMLSVAATREEPFGTNLTLKPCKFLRIVLGHCMSLHPCIRSEPSPAIFALKAFNPAVYGVRVFLQTAFVCKSFAAIFTERNLFSLVCVDMLHIPRFHVKLLRTHRTSPSNIFLCIMLLHRMCFHTHWRCELPPAIWTFMRLDLEMDTVNVPFQTLQCGDFQSTMLALKRFPSIVRFQVLLKGIFIIKQLWATWTLIIFNFQMDTLNVFSQLPFRSIPLLWTRWTFLTDKRSADTMNIQQMRFESCFISKHLAALWTFPPSFSMRFLVF